jgi:D-alanyl-D-alanine dipeptidase
MQCELINEHPDFQALEAISGLKIDLRYATNNNFVGRNLYGGLHCAWVHREAGAGLALSVAWLHRNFPGYVLVVLDALRPHRVQLELWAHFKDSDLRQYLADPARGSIHSFGMAVDVTLLDPAGHEVDMGTAFDALTLLSHPQHEEKHRSQGLLDDTQIANRLILRQAMCSSGFHGISSEWWHFDFGDRGRVRRDFERVD